MFMGRIIYEPVYKSIYESGFYKANALPYDLGMSDLKKTIISEMSKRDWKPTELARVSKVPQPTIQRFLSGTHGEPRSATIKKIAAAFGMTELELRGYNDNEHKIHNETLNNTLYKAIEQLSIEQQKQIEQFVLFLASQTPATPQQNENKPLTEEIKDVGGGKSEPVQLQQSQDQRVKSEFYAMVGAVCDKTNW